MLPVTWDRRLLATSQHLTLLIDTFHGGQARTSRATIRTFGLIINDVEDGLQKQKEEAARLAALIMEYLVKNIDPKCRQFRFIVAAPDAEVRFRASFKAAVKKDSIAKNVPSIFAFHDPANQIDTILVQHMAEQDEVATDRDDRAIFEFEEDAPTPAPMSIDYTPEGEHYGEASPADLVSRTMKSRLHLPTPTLCPNSRPGTPSSTKGRSRAGSDAGDVSPAESPKLVEFPASLEAPAGPRREPSLARSPPSSCILNSILNFFATVVFALSPPAPCTLLSANASSRAIAD
ncbi:hypothetical protein K523DRAFT_356657 [Schizophyllum commune Tattone D]|nr:hypothetical protein K523DRAFT_356657 [Schizophyllum commune Tattone D]